MITQKVGEFERIISFKPAYHKIHEDPKQNYGVGGVTIFFVLKGPKGAITFSEGSGMMLQETWDYWEAKGLNQKYKMHMGYDVSYHSPTPRREGQEVAWPTKMVEKNPDLDKKTASTEEQLLNVDFEKVGDKAPICDWIGVPCYTDGSAMAGDDFEKALLSGGDDAVWKKLEEWYNSEFND